MSNDNGGPAFPSEEPSFTDRQDILGYYPGMTLRDYFAAKAMHGFITNFDTRRSDIIDVPELSRSAYYVADAMISERNKAK